MTNSRPTVSAIIPTIGRLELREAVDSALAQTYGIHEVIIGADTSDDLDLPDDPRVRIVRTGPRAGGNVARMAAIEAATGDLIALLDDDDIWSPTKLDRQSSAIRNIEHSSWVSSTQVLEPSGRSWPARLLSEDERIPHYLFRKERIRAGQGAMHTSTLIFPRSLVLKVPFDRALRFHQDTDWLVRLDHALPAIKTIQVEEPLTMLRAGDGSVSRGIDPLESLAWAKRSLTHLDRRSRGEFLLTVTYWQALRHRHARGRVLWNAFTWGTPGWKAIPSVVVLPLKSSIFRR
ncbi:MAG: glycosyltransferase [Microbacterium sp.]